jgi:hypothetical protein
MTDDDKPEGAAKKTPSSKPPPRAKEELFEAIEHFRKAATILFERAQEKPAMKEAERVVDKVTEAADPVLDKVQAATKPVVDKVAEATEPVVKQAVSELAKLTRSLLDAVDKPPAKKDE